MSNVRKYWVWLLLSCKRLLRKISFLFLLVLIPVVVPLTNAAMAGESGVLHIGLCNQDENSVAQNIIDELTEDSGLLRFSVFGSEEDAIRAVEEHKMDAAWIFVQRFDVNMDAYTKGDSKKPLVSVVEREDTVPLQLSREILYGAVYQKLSLSLYRNFVYSEVLTEAEAPAREVQVYYDEVVRNRGIIEMKRLGTDSVMGETNYLTAPLRGILSLLVVLCTLAAALYFLQDQKSGTYDWLAAKKRIAPAFALCFSSAILSATAVFVALQFAGISVGFWHELLSMLLFAFSSAGFGLLFCALFRSAGKLGAAIPGIMLIMLVLSPIFFNLKILRFIRILLPTYYYLQSTYNVAFYLYTVIYCIGIYGAAFLAWRLKQRSLFQHRT